MKFPKNTFVNDGVYSNNFLQNVRNIVLVREIIHHSHVTGEIIGCTYSFCDQKVRENKNQISAIAQNLFGLDLFCF